ncbi:MAG: DUF5661 family protein [Thermoleophilia bacterium]
MNQIANQPGVHLDHLKHRWVRDEDVKPGTRFYVPHHEELDVRSVKDGKAEVGLVGHPITVDVPEKSVKYFHADMHGQLNHKPDSGNEHVDAVIRGEGEHLGKGNDGIVYRHGEKVVKVSTTVPYQPFNRGQHRTPEEALRHLQKEHEAHTALQGIPGVPEVDGQEHEGRYWMVKPHLSPTGVVDEKEAHQVRDSVRAMHAKGWVLGDTVQVGRDKSGGIQFMDLGSAHKSDSDYQREHDEERLASFFHLHRLKYTDPPAEVQKKERVARTLLDMAIKHQDPEKVRAHRIEWKRLASEHRMNLVRKDDFDGMMAFADITDAMEKRLEKAIFLNGQKRNPKDFDEAALSQGIRVEMEHTDDPKIAIEIAMDHLAERPDYYDRLEEMEAKPIQKAILSGIRFMYLLRKSQLNLFDWHGEPVQHEHREPIPTRPRMGPGPLFAEERASAPVHAPLPPMPPPTSHTFTSNIHVKSHLRRLPSGEVVEVAAHERTADRVTHDDPKPRQTKITEYADKPALLKPPSMAPQPREMPKPFTEEQLKAIGEARVRQEAAGGTPGQGRPWVRWPSQPAPLCCESGETWARAPGSGKERPVDLAGRPAPMAATGD